MGNTRFYEPNDGHRMPHDPFKAIVAPRPIPTTRREHLHE
jgi:hypothetical protein